MDTKFPWSFNMVKLKKAFIRDYIKGVVKTFDTYHRAAKGGNPDSQILNFGSSNFKSQDKNFVRKNFVYFQVIAEHCLSLGRC